MPDLAPVGRALLSVSDKTDLIPFARALDGLGVELISTGGTARAIEEAGIDKVRAHLDDATGKGAKVVTGGAPHNAGPLFFQPTVVTGVTRDMRVAREETFGPIAPLFRFSDEADVVAQANDTEFGLAAYFYARDLGRVWRVAEALEYGMVAVNSGILSTEVAPFGGIKQSGLGREGSKYGVDEFVEIKYVLMGGL